MTERSAGEIQQDKGSKTALSPQSTQEDGRPTLEQDNITVTDDEADINGLEQSRELTPPALPPRPKNLDLLDGRPPPSGTGSLRLPERSSRHHLQSQATTAFSKTDVHTQRHIEPTNVQSSPASTAVSRKHSFTHFSRFKGNSETDDSTSVKSYAPTLETGLDNESLLGDVVGDEASPAWKALSAQVERCDPFEHLPHDDDQLNLAIRHEFDEPEAYAADGSNDTTLLSQWKSKLKHFFILSASGKPVYSRHGDDQMISHYVGVIQTLISSYQSNKNPLRSFKAGDARFVMLSKGPLNLVAVSRLVESDAQLRTQLESLYMQILSTLTLPSMERMFSNRPSTDLRRPLQGTEILLDGLCDGFTRGSPSTLLSALECLRLRKTHRRLINDTLLHVRSPSLLYGLIVAAGRLVSVVRPKKHSLHPGDLQLIFNMLFEAGSVKAGGGENWIPLCLPGFNNTGFVYMYVNFFSTAENATTSGDERPSSAGADDELAFVFISASKEAFFDLRKMRNALVKQMGKDGGLALIKTAIRKGHASCSDIIPGTVLRHFLYKSRSNVQFVMPSFEPHYHGVVAKRRLLSLYARMHESIHSRTSHLKVQYCVASDSTALAWETPLFELYCIAGPQTSRSVLAGCANRIVQWIRKEEARVFIIGGAVF